MAKQNKKEKKKKQFRYSIKLFSKNLSAVQNTILSTQYTRKSVVHMAVNGENAFFYVSCLGPSVRYFEQNPWIIYLTL